MKMYILKFVAKCNCQQVNVQHQNSRVSSKDINIPTWKWEDMDFVICLPRNRRQHYSIWVIVHRTKRLAYFIPFKVSYSVKDYAKLDLKEMVRFHGVPWSIISHHDTKFTSQFYKSFWKGLGTHIMLSKDFHPQTDGKEKCNIHILEYILRVVWLNSMAIAMNYLPLIVFAK